MRWDLKVLWARPVITTKLRIQTHQIWLLKEITSGIYERGVTIMTLLGDLKVYTYDQCVITSSVWMEFATVRVCLRAASRCKVSNFRVSKYSENFLKVVLSVHTIVSLALGVYLFWMKHFFTVVVLYSYIVYFVTESYFSFFSRLFPFFYFWQILTNAVEKRKKNSDTKPFKD